MPKAAIDIGSNSILLTVMDDEGVVLHDEARVVGLGRGLGDGGLFAPDRLQAAEACLVDYIDIARTYGVDPWALKAVATSAARRAHNADTWVARIQRKHGLRIRVISGEEEARLTWLGATTGFASMPSGPILVVDLGGGSTELVLGEGERVDLRTSLEIGSVRLTERFLGTEVVDPAQLAHLRKHVDIEFAKLELDPLPRTVIGVAGTVTTLASIHRGLTRYDPDQVHGSFITRADFAGFVDRLLPATPAERQQIAAVSPARADFLLAGTVILDRALAAARRQRMVVSDRGLRYGLLQ